MTTVQEIVQQTNRQLMAAIETQPAAMRAVLTHVRGQMASPRLRDLMRNAGSVFLTGCGDSLFAGMATQQTFLRYGGIMAQAVEALEYSRYLGPYAPHDSLLIAVSNSGRVSRTAEAAALSARLGGAIAITDAPESRLATAATLSVSVGLPPMAAGATGTRSYQASMLALYVLAITLGEARGFLSTSEAEDLHQLLDASVEAVAWTIGRSRAVVEQVIPRILSERVLYVIGGGPNYGTAHYGAAKFLEALALSGVPVELEEWAHLQFHIAAPDTTFVVLAPTGNGRDRVLEQLRGLRDMGAPSIVVAPEGDEEAAIGALAVLPVSGRLPEEFSPLEMCVPLQWLAAHLAAARGTTMRMLMDEDHRDVNFRQIFDSEIVTLPRQARV